MFHVLIAGDNKIHCLLTCLGKNFSKIFLGNGIKLEAFKWELNKNNWEYFNIIAFLQEG